MRLEQITFTRFIAAIAIVVFHFGRKIYPFDNESVRFLFKSANVGVSYFFILSGFIMVIAYAKNVRVDFVEYMQNRFARIYPVYFLALLLFLIYNLVAKVPVHWLELLLNLTGTQAWVPVNVLTLNAPGWSLSVELLFYLLFPFLFNNFYSKEGAVRKLTVAIILFFIASQGLFYWLVSSPSFGKGGSISPDFIYYSPLMHLNQFLVGNLAGIFFLKIGRHRYGNHDIAVAVVVLLMVLALKYLVPTLNFHNGLMALLFVPLIYLVCLNNGLISTVSKARPLVFLGEISFGIYILQFPVFYYVSSLFGHYGFIEKAPVFYICTVSLVIAAAISYVVVETPLRNLLKSKRAHQVINKYKYIKYILF